MQNIYHSALKLLLSSCFLASLSAHAKIDFASYKTPLSLSNPDLRQMIAASGISARQMSFYVQAIDSPQPLIAQNASRAQNPASVIKLVTSYAALKTLGADYQWHTDFLSDSKPDNNGVLNTPLYLKGGGDPQLVIEKVDELARGLAQVGVKHINGPVLIDRSIFKDEVQDASSFDGEPSMPYNAQPDAALMNFRAISFNFNPVMQQLSTVPALADYAVNNQIQWITGTCPLAGWKSSLSLNYTATAATVGGRYYSDCGEQQWHVHAYQMSANSYVQKTLNGLLPYAITRIGDGLTSKGAMVLSRVLSKPLKDELKDMNHFSNNVMARQMYLSLSAQKYGQGSLKGSADVVNQVLAKQGLSMSSLVMDNGSGLSRLTAIRAQDLGALLVKAAHEQALYDSLPIIGISGTMKNRLKDTDMVGRGRIKTGTLDDVRAIAGYIDGKSGRRYAVVSIIEGAQAQTEAGKQVHDALMQWVGAQ